MPVAPMRLCPAPGCTIRVVKGRCAAHTRQVEQRRGTRQQRGYDHAWLKLRAWFLTQHPLCVFCEQQGHITAATDVDHIVPFCGLDDPRRLNVLNLRALCNPCHMRHHATARTPTAGGAQSLAPARQGTAPVPSRSDRDFKSFKSPEIGPA